MAKLDGNSTRDGVSEDRVKTNGQVFTPDSTVNDMLNETDKKIAEYFGVNTVEEVSDSDYIDYIVLEPTCGNGNFIIRLLDRKLSRVNKLTGNEREIALLRAVASIYGIELTAENVIATKLRMMEVIEKGSTELFELEYKTKSGFSTKGFELDENMRKSIHYILDRNIQCGNCLTFKKFLIWKSNYIHDIWTLNINRLNIADALFRTTEKESELVMTQYDFSNELVALRERTYKNIHETKEEYINTSNYVNYKEIYSLASVEIFEDDSVDDSDDEFEF